jgi:aerobic-type carbon monoxide dehydrogenase small subunit (CoxS/CutS family)
MATVTRLNVNGRELPLEADAERTLLSVLRDDLQLTGCKPGCGEGQCGACTVLLDGKPVRACRTPAGTASQAKIRTIEDLEKDGKLHPVQQAFLDADALQCGYCTCGMILSAVALLEEHPQPSEEQFLAAMDGNICRCGVYNNIRAAVKSASETLASASR